MRKIPTFIADRVVSNVRRVFATRADAGKSPEAVARYYLEADLRVPLRALDRQQLAVVLQRARAVAGRRGALGDLDVDVPPAEDSLSPSSLLDNLPTYSKDQQRTINIARAAGALALGWAGFKKSGGAGWSTFGFGVMGALAGGMVGATMAGQPESTIGEERGR